LIRQKIPSVEEVGDIRNNQILERVRNMIKEGDLTKYADLLEPLLSEEYSALDIAAAFLKMASVTEIAEEDPGFDMDDLKNTGASAGRVRFFVSIGKAQEITARDLVDAVSKAGGVENRQIERVSIHDRFSFFEAPMDKAKNIINGMKKKDIKGFRVHIAPAMKK
jgi:ATP-dependent RNA helicase DeaD